jgi:hypothetical protein
VTAEHAAWGPAPDDLVAHHLSVRLRRGGLASLRIALPGGWVEVDDPPGGELDEGLAARAVRPGAARRWVGVAADAIAALLGGSPWALLGALGPPVEGGFAVVGIAVAEIGATASARTIAAGLAAGAPQLCVQVGGGPERQVVDARSLRSRPGGGHLVERHVRAPFPVVGLAVLAHVLAPPPGFEPASSGLDRALAALDARLG